MQYFIQLREEMCVPTDTGIFVSFFSIGDSFVSRFVAVLEIVKTVGACNESSALSALEALYSTVTLET